MKSISNFNDQSDYWYILPAILFIDLVVIVISRYFPNVFGKVLNVWYNTFGLNAVIADVFIIAIGFMIARWIYTRFLGKTFGMNPGIFMIVLVLVQLVHDVLFYFGIIVPTPRGANQMIDVFKDYADENGGKILLADAGMMVGSGVVAMLLKNSSKGVYEVFTILTIYLLPYFLEHQI